MCMASLCQAQSYKAPKPPLDMKALVCCTLMYRDPHVLGRLGHEISRSYGAVISELGLGEGEVGSSVPTLLRPPHNFLFGL